MRRLDGACPWPSLPPARHASLSPHRPVGCCSTMLSLYDAPLPSRPRRAARTSRAIYRLTGAVRAFTLADGRLAASGRGLDAGPQRNLPAALLITIPSLPPPVDLRLRG